MRRPGSAGILGGSHSLQMRRTGWSSANAGSRMRSSPFRDWGWALLCLAARILLPILSNPVRFGVRAGCGRSRD